MHTIRKQSLPQFSRFASIGLLAFCSMMQAQQAQHYKQTNLISDIPGMAPTTDPNLVNPWGLSRSSGSPWWVSNNGPGLATLYTGTGAINPLVVTIPGADGAAQARLPGKSSTVARTSKLPQASRHYSFSLRKTALSLVGIPESVQRPLL